MANLASMYANGWGVPRDLAQATRWFRLASDAGNDYAKKWLADNPGN
jgi:TPR repeat protein